MGGFMNVKYIYFCLKIYTALPNYIATLNKHFSATHYHLKTINTDPDIACKCTVSSAHVNQTLLFGKRFISKLKIYSYKQI